jgi:hypothetical protein
MKQLRDIMSENLEIIETLIFIILLSNITSFKHNFKAKFYVA